MLTKSIWTAPRPCAISRDMRRNPKQQRAQDKVQTMLDAARRVLIRDGFEKFTTNHVAAEAGCNIGTVYRYFPEKNEIIKRLYLDWLDSEKAINIQAVQDLNAPVEPADFVATLFRRHLESHDEDAHRLSVELTKALYLNTEVRALDERYDSELVATISQGLKDYTSYSFNPEQIGYVLKLAISLLIMINLADPEERLGLSDMAVVTLQRTVQSFYA